MLIVRTLTLTAERAPRLLCQVRLKTTMASLTSDQACATLPPVQVDYTPKGKWLDEGLNGLKTYFTGDGPTKNTRALLYIYDIFGFCPQNYQGADMLATQGIDVYIPDMFVGKGLDPNLKNMNAEDKQKAMAAFREGFPGDPDTQIKPLTDLVKLLREEKGYDKVAGIGFCWGGALVSLVPSLDAIIMCHPATRKGMDAEAASKLNSPTLLLPSMNEDANQMKEFHEVMRQKTKIGELCILKTYNESVHGWMAARADLNDEKQKEKFSEGFQDAATFLNKVL